jgi:sulfonate transport system permease protein
MADIDTVLDGPKPGRIAAGIQVFEKFKIYANLLLAPAVLLLVWQLLSSAGLLMEVVLPSPVKVVKALAQITKDGSLALDFTTSAGRVFKGYLWGVGVGLSIGVSCGLSKFMERLTGPIVDTIRQIPMMAWIPLIILWFGIGETSKTIIIAKSVFVPVFVNTLQGIRGVPRDYIEVAAVLELSRVKLLRTVILPSALPSIFTGLRLGAGFSWMAVVAAEMLGGLTGLGYGLLRARDFLESDKLIALMIVIGLVGLVLDRLIRLLESKVLHWRKTFNG